MKNKIKSQHKFHVRSGDTVKVIAGNAKGTEGRVIRILTDKNRILVEGVNIQTKHVKPTAQSPQGELRKQEGSIHISNVMLVDPSTGEPTKTGRRKNDKGKLQRYSKATDKLI
jgi:large subunit ribosomal protein L24